MLSSWRKTWGDTFANYGADLQDEEAHVLFVVQTFLAAVARIWTLTRWQQAQHKVASPFARTNEGSIDLNCLSDEAFNKFGWLGFQIPCFDWWLASDSSIDRCSADKNEVSESASLWNDVAVALQEPTKNSHPLDHFRALTMATIPRKVRHAKGEYYTPPWLAQWVLDRVSYSGRDTLRFLDPACGSGTFVVEALSRWLSQRVINGSEKITSAKQLPIAGVDCNPLAVFLARANYAAAICPHLQVDQAPIQVPIHFGDTIRMQRFQMSMLEPQGQPTSERVSSEPLEIGRYDVVAGNPPWVGWESLPLEARRATRPLWEKYGLFTARGMEAILGRGRKDLSMLMSYTVGDHLLQPNGQLSFVITNAVFRNAGAGAGFRQLDRSRQNNLTLGLTLVDDFSSFQPFVGANTNCCVFVCQKDTSTRYPISYREYSLDQAKPRDLSELDLSEMQNLLHCIEKTAEPSDSNDPGSGWLVLPEKQRNYRHQFFGASSYQAHEGVNSGGANGIYWLEVLEQVDDELVRVRNRHDLGKQTLPQIEAILETRYLYPLVRGSQLKRWEATSDTLLLCVQDPHTRRGIKPDVMRQLAPRTLQYLEQFEPQLRQRAAFRRYFQKHSRGESPIDQAPFYSMFNVGAYTFAPYKVAWHRMRSPLQASILTTVDDKLLLPQETHAFVPLEHQQESIYLAAILNSDLFNELAESTGLAGGKSFASPHILQRVRVPMFDATCDVHRSLVEIGKRFAIHDELEENKKTLERLTEQAFLRQASLS